LFSVLGQLKGGAMKFGQALSVFEAALPRRWPGRTGRRSPNCRRPAPPMPVASVHKAMAEQLGADWRDRFTDFDDSPAAAASIGQVHRAVWKLPPARRNARPKTLPVAVKVQYPGAAEALLADLKQLSRLAGMFKIIQPGMDIKPLLAELRARITEELDYAMEAEAQSAFAAAYAGDAEIFVPHGGRLAPAGAGHRVGGRHAAGQGDQRGHRGGARRGRPADGDAELLGARPDRSTARRPASRQLPHHAGRPARRDRLRRGGPAARRPSRSRSAGWSGWRWTATRRRWQTVCATRASSSRTTSWTPRRCSPSCAR
jgi:hypothetical protein